MSTLAVRLNHVSKKYLLRHEKPTLVENVLQRKSSEEFWAINDLSLNIRKGEKLGIIGPNGSGKTTLLKIIAGITAPTSGEIETQGKVVSLIELSAGFQPDLTGEENILLNGLLIGMSKEEIRCKKDAIVQFADIGSFIDAPFYAYSAGMALRLGFSIAIHSDPDILLLDENLAVGDQDFQKKSQKKMEQFFRENKTIILVSHWLDFIKNNCSSVILLKNGSIVRKGSYSSVERYYSYL